MLVDRPDASLRRTDDRVVFDQVAAAWILIVLRDIDGLTLKCRTRGKSRLTRLLNVCYVVVNYIVLDLHANGQIAGVVELRARVLKRCCDVVYIGAELKLP